MIRKVVVGSGLIALIPSVSAAIPVQDSIEPKRPPPMKPSELPIYEAPHADYGEYVIKTFFITLINVSDNIINHLMSF